MYISNRSKLFSHLPTDFYNKKDIPVRFSIETPLFTNWIEKLLKSLLDSVWPKTFMTFYHFMLTFFKK